MQPVVADFKCIENKNENAQQVFDIIKLIVVVVRRVLVSSCYPLSLVTFWQDKNLFQFFSKFYKKNYSYFILNKYLLHIQNPNEFPGHGSCCSVV